MHWEVVQCGVQPSYQHMAWNYTGLGGNETMGKNTTDFGQNWQ